MALVVAALAMALGGCSGNGAGNDAAATTTTEAAPTTTTTEAPLERGQAVLVLRAGGG